MRFINSTFHGLLDYAAAAALIALPLLLNIAEQSPLAMYMSVAAGIGLIAYSLITNYHYSVAKVISFKIHLMLDLAAAVFFLAAPLIFGFEGVAKIYYWVMGAGVLLVVLFSNVPALTTTTQST
jgi:hypothetical protein